MSEESVAFTGLIVLVRGEENKLHLAPLTSKQSARVRRFVTQLHGGSLHVSPEDLILLTESDALDAFGRLTGKVPWRERIRRFFRKSERPTSNVQRPTSNDGGRNEPFSTKFGVVGNPPSLRVLSSGDHEQEAS